MRLESIRAGDIVQIDDGLPYLAHVEQARGVGGNRLIVVALNGSHAMRTVKARDVVAHWRRTGARAAS
jgi:hypothetical protein